MGCIYIFRGYLGSHANFRPMLLKLCCEMAASSYVLTTAMQNPCFVYTVIIHVAESDQNYSTSVTLSFALCCEPEKCQLVAVTTEVSLVQRASTVVTNMFTALFSYSFILVLSLFYNCR